MLELYKDLIIDHGLNPRNKYKMEKFTHTGIAYNHFCGDSFILYLNIVNKNIYNISFTGEGCSISVASASLMTLNLKNKNLNEALDIFNYFKHLIQNNEEKNDKYIDINILKSVNKFPSRIKCATLIWHTFKNIITIN